MKDLRESTKFAFTFGHPEVKSKLTSFKSEFDYKTARIILNLTNQNPVVTNIIQNIPTSVIDIDVIYENLQIGDDLASLISILNLCHQIEKEFFFGMLKEDFLKSLNPGY